MGFSWLTFIAQIVNLFVLIWLLKHFLYRPVLDVIDKRQSLINDQVSAAQRAKDQTDREKEEWEKEKSRFDDIRQKRLNDLAKEEEDLRKQSDQEIKKAGYEKRSQMQQALNTEISSIQEEIRTIVTKQFVSLSQKVFTELTEHTPMDNVLHTIGNKIKQLPQKEKKEIEKNLIKQNKVAVISSAALTVDQQQELCKVLKENFSISKKTDISWQENTNLIFGLEIHLGNTVLEWNLKNYLEELQQNIRQETTSLILSEKDE